MLLAGVLGKMRKMEAHEAYRLVEFHPVDDDAFSRQHQAEIWPQSHSQRQHHHA